MSEEPKSYGSAMSIERYLWLMDKGSDIALSKEETDAGWHFCTTAWDGLLIHPVDLEYGYCVCSNHQPHKRSAAYYSKLQKYQDWINNDGKGRHYPDDFKNIPQF